jgi:threonine/homoserine/homoserine lactone efflux protein
VLGYRIYRIEPAVKVPTISTNGLLGAYATTFFLTISNPVTILSFIAIYAGWHVPTLHGHYMSAALLTMGVFIGSGMWWVVLFTGLTLFRMNISHGFLGWVHRISGAVIVGFGITVLLSLSLSPLRRALNITF